MASIRGFRHQVNSDSRAFSVQTSCRASFNLAGFEVVLVCLCKWCTPSTSLCSCWVLCVTACGVLRSSHHFLRSSSFVDHGDGWLTDTAAQRMAFRPQRSGITSGHVRQHELLANAVTMERWKVWFASHAKRPTLAHVPHVAVVGWNYHRLCSRSTSRPWLRNEEINAFQPTSSRGEVETLVLGFKVFVHRKPSSKTVIWQEQGSQVCSSLKIVDEATHREDCKKGVEDDAVSRNQLLAREKQLTKQLQLASSLQRVWKKIFNRGSMERCCRRSRIWSNVCSRCCRSIRRFRKVSMFRDLHV